MGAVFGGGGLLLIPVLVLTGASLLDSGQNIAVTAYMALVPMFFGYLLFGYGLTKVSASTATTVTLTEPAIATVLAVLIVGERLTALGWAGLVVIAGVLVILALAPTNADPISDAAEISRRRSPESAARANKAQTEGGKPAVDASVASPR